MVADEKNKLVKTSYHVNVHKNSHHYMFKKNTKLEAIAILILRYVTQQTHITHCASVLYYFVALSKEYFDVAVLNR